TTWIAAISKVLESIAAAPTAPLCISCDKPLHDRTPLAVAFITASRMDKSVAGGMTVCGECYHSYSPETLMQRVREGVRVNMFGSGAQVCVVSDQVGTA